MGRCRENVKYEKEWQTLQRVAEGGSGGGVLSRVEKTSLVLYGQRMLEAEETKI